MGLLHRLDLGDLLYLLYGLRDLLHLLLYRLWHRLVYSLLEVCHLTLLLLHLALSTTTLTTGGHGRGGMCLIGGMSRVAIGNRRLRRGGEERDGI